MFDSESCLLAMVLSLSNFFQQCLQVDRLILSIIPEASEFYIYNNSILSG